MEKSLKETLKKINNEQQKYKLFLQYKENEVNSILMNEFLKADGEDFEIEFDNDFFLNKESYKYGHFNEIHLEKYLKGRQVNFEFKITKVVNSKSSLVYIIKIFKDSVIYSLFTKASEIENLYGDLLRNEIIEQCKANEGLNIFNLNLEKLRLIYKDFTDFDFGDWLKLENINTYILREKDNKYATTISIIF